MTIAVGVGAEVEGVWVGIFVNVVGALVCKGLMVDGRSVGDRLVPMLVGAGDMRADEVGAGVMITVGRRVSGRGVGRFGVMVIVPGLGRDDGRGGGGQAYLLDRPFLLCFLLLEALPLPYFAEPVLSHP
jgi:hypothetical protein